MAAAQSAVPADAPYKNPKLPVEPRVADLLGRMTLKEKVSMLAGSGWMESMPMPRLGIPAIKMADGPMGVRAWYGSSAITNAANSQLKPVYSTSFPAGVCMAATWDPALVRREGDAIGQEVKALGRDMILGPTVNINRQPLWGRNFEGYGEDPFLSGRMGAAYVRGVQGQGVIPSVKHFDANNEEFERHRIDAHISERALHEIYLPAFKAAVDAGAWNVMSAYNLVNGAHMAQNSPLLHDVLEKEFGFKGFVVSDWASTYSTAPTVNAGMDLEMPGGPPMEAMMKTARAQEEGSGDGWLVPDKVMAEIKAGKITKAQIDDNVGRILRVEFEAGLFEHQHGGGGEVDTPDEQAVALEGATEGIVLLKNEGGLLPLDRSEGAFDCGDRAQCGGCAHGRRRQFAGAAEAGDCAAGWNQGSARGNIAGELRAGCGHGGRGSGARHSGGASTRSEGSGGCGISCGCGDRVRGTVLRAGARGRRCEDDGFAGGAG